MSIRSCLTIVAVTLLACSAPALWAAASEPTKVRPAVVGSQLPDAPVLRGDGTSLPLREAVGAGKAVLIVYRGGWCPICTRHFAALGQAREELVAKDWSLVAISPDSPESIAAWIDEHGDDGIVRYSDSDVDAIEALGLAYTLDAETRAKYREYGLDLAAASGQDHYILPVPAVLLVVDGEIRWFHADADYRRRLERPLLRAAVDAVERSLEADEAQP